MKKIIMMMTLMMCLSLSLSFGQDFKKIFLGKDWSLYKGLHLKYEEGTITGMDFCFYSSKPTESSQVPVYGRTSRYNFVTDTLSIKDRDFLVINVENLNNGFSNDRYSLFELNDGKETLYFIYDSKYQHNFPFVVKGFTYSADYLSKDIKKNKDDFTDDITIRTPLGKDMSITKIIRNGSIIPIYYLNLETFGSTLNVNVNGVILLFKDGTKWIRANEKIDVRVNGSKWVYSAFITLNKEDLQLFSTKEVNKFRLYIYDNNKPDDPDKFVYYTQAIIKMN